MNAGQLAALIAAGFWAVLVCAAVYVLVRLARLISVGTRAVTEYRDRADLLIERAQAAVDRTNEQLARTDAITASMDQVSANMAEMSGHVSALAGLARGISAAIGTPMLRCAAAVYGVRRAIALRRPSRPRAGERTTLAATGAPIGPGGPAGPGPHEPAGTRAPRSRPRAITGSGRRQRAGR
jgi:Bacterial protein of unknown function (DUF948)